MFETDLEDSLLAAMRSCAICRLRRAGSLSLLAGRGV
jgi:hypothetical protein